MPASLPAARRTALTSIAKGTKGGVTTWRPSSFAWRCASLRGTVAMASLLATMVSTLSQQVEHALRDKQVADQQTAAVKALEAQMDVKRKLILAKIDKVNGAAMKQAMAVFEQTGHYPPISLPTEHTVSIQALQAALTREGDPYVWGAAGPSEFDCSGLVVWAYAQEGISLPHYTGWLWNSGVHVARSDLEPGDLVFFFPNISHVGMYIGNGLMIDAPNFREVVRVQPIYWSAFVGAVRIA